MEFRLSSGSRVSVLGALSYPTRVKVSAQDGLESLLGRAPSSPCAPKVHEDP